MVTRVKCDGQKDPDFCKVQSVKSKGMASKTDQCLQDGVHSKLIGQSEDLNQQKEVSMNLVATRPKQGFNLKFQMGQGPWMYERLVVDNENNDKSL